MTRDLPDPSAQFYAQTYDASVPNWPGEIDFYLSLAAEATSKSKAVLEVACGTGRVAIRLAQAGARVTGLDLSTQMLDVAREKSRDIPNIHWVEGDMRSFELSELFGLIIIPGHSFQNLLTPEDQLATLGSIRRHLLPGGTLVVHLDHQSVDWLGELVGPKGGAFEPAEEFPHPATGRLVRTSRAWWYEPATQTAIAHTVWEELDVDGEVSRRWERGPTRFHCVFRYEMQHLLALVGFKVEAVYGNFLRGSLEDSSEEMIWVATEPIAPDLDR